MRLIDDALGVCHGPYIAAPQDRLRAALVALADAGMLCEAATVGRLTAALVAAQGRVDTALNYLASINGEHARHLTELLRGHGSKCLATSRGGLTCCVTGPHAVHRHEHANSGAITSWSG